MDAYARTTTILLSAFSCHKVLDWSSFNFYSGHATPMMNEDFILRNIYVKSLLLE